MTAELLKTNGECRVSDVLVVDRLRPVSRAGVDAIIASINELGIMKDAIHVRKKSGGLILLAGGHRLEAAKRLGWEMIPAKVWKCNDDWARLIEIDDNLAGAELNALDTAVFLAARKAIYEKLHPETRAGVAGALARWDANELSSFASVTAEKFGLSKRQIEKITAAGMALTTENARKLQGAPQHVTLSDLIEIAACQSADERSYVVTHLADGKVTKAARARRLWAQKEHGAPALKDPIETAALKIRQAFARAPKEARRRFVRAHVTELLVLLNGLDREGESK